MLLNSFILLLPLFVLTFGGFILARIFTLEHNTLVRVITDFLMPMLIFYSLYTGEVRSEIIAELAGSASFVMFLLLGVSFVYGKAVRMETKSLIPPVIFMNSGFLGIPLMKLWGGMEAMNYIVVYDQIQTIYIFTLGILIVTGGFSIKGLRETVLSPILWAIFLGFLFKGFHIPIHSSLLNVFEFGGQAAPPLAAVALGVSLYHGKLHFNLHLASGALLRIVCGFLAALAAVTLFDVQGLPRTVILVASSLPSAVFSSVLPLRYGIEAEFAGTMVVLTTLLGIVTIPFSFYLATLL